MADITIIPRTEFTRILEASAPKTLKVSLLADMCRLNTLAIVKRAGSGHLGSSFSAMDVLAWLYFSEMNTRSLGFDSPSRDIYFSSKGHDVPGQYSVLFALGVIPQERFLRLRRLSGMDGHPDISVPGIEANTGSLGMGISKAKGMALAKRLGGLAGRVIVMTGDGEWQEGQNFEALQSAAHLGLSNLTVIVDHNKVQSDKLVTQIVSLRDLARKFEAFGWRVEQCDGHDLGQVDAALAAMATETSRPKILIANTIKGKGVSFMEHPAALEVGKGIYRWHAGAPDDASFFAANEEILARVNHKLITMGLQSLTLDIAPLEEVQESRAAPSNEYVVKAFGEALLDAGARRSDLVVLDGDLAADCRVRDFENTFPKRFIECGIAEQDMVSTAGGLARSGFLPVVNSFASFLTSRANEQIFNNASEGTKIIYACHYAGLIPAGPGKSHQSLRDISLLSAIPNCQILQPCNADETRMAVDYCVDEALENCALRLAIGPSPRRIHLPPTYRLRRGRGVTLADGEDAALISYGPVMLHEALNARDILADRGFGLSIVNMPWLNRIDRDWLLELIKRYSKVYVLEDHSITGGLGDRLLEAIQGPGDISHGQLIKFAVEGYPACGTPAEVLNHHGLDGRSIADRIIRVSAK